MSRLGLPVPIDFCAREMDKKFYPSRRQCRHQGGGVTVPTQSLEELGEIDESEQLRIGTKFVVEKLWEPAPALKLKVENQIVDRVKALDPEVVFVWVGNPYETVWEQDDPEKSVGQFEEYYRVHVQGADWGTRASLEGSTTIRILL